MGLNINVLKPLVPTLENINNKNYYTYNLDESPELNIFKEFSFEKENKYYNLEKGLLELGYNLNDLYEISSTQSPKNVIFEYRDTKHELFECFNELNEIWHKAYYSNKKELFESEEFKIYLKYKDVLIKNGYKPKYKFFASGNGSTYYNLNSAWNFSNRKTRVILKNPTTFKKVDICIVCEEIADQRKGANKKFYEDGIWNSPYIITKEVLLEHWKKYFSNNTPESIGGFGSDVEYSLEDDELKNMFKKNIIDVFVEGEHFVAYQ